MGHSGELNKQKIRIVTQGFRTRQTMAFSVQSTFLHLIAIMNYDTNSLERIRLFKPGVDCLLILANDSYYGDRCHFLSYVTKMH